MSHDYDPLDDAGRERDEEREKQLARTRADELLQDVKWLMAGPRGRRFLRWLFDEVDVPHGDAFATNALLMSRKLGQQDSARRIFALVLGHCLPDYTVLIDEGKKTDERSEGRTN